MDSSQEAIGCGIDQIFSLSRPISNSPPLTITNALTQSSTSEKRPRTEQPDEVHSSVATASREQPRSRSAVHDQGGACSTQMVERVSYTQVSCPKQSLITEYDTILAYRLEEYHKEAQRAHRLSVQTTEDKARKALQCQQSEFEEHLRSVNFNSSEKGRIELAQLQAKMAATRHSEYHNLRREAEQCVQRSLNDGRRTSEAKLEDVIKQARTAFSSETATRQRLDAELQQRNSHLSILQVSRTN